MTCLLRVAASRDSSPAVLCDELSHGSGRDLDSICRHPCIGSCLGLQVLPGYVLLLMGRIARDAKHLSRQQHESAGEWQASLHIHLKAPRHAELSAVEAEPA